MPPEMNKNLGKLIVLEGPDGAGKTTVVDLFMSHLEEQGILAQRFSFPGRVKGTLGELIYRIHHNHGEEFKVDSITPLALQALHVAAHLDSIENNIVPLLREGVNVVMDRFWWSTWVYGRLSNANPKCIDRLIDAEIEAWGEYQPDHAILIDRDSSLREDGMKDWVPLRNLYHELIAYQEGRYPISIIKNINDPLDTVREVCAVVGFSLPARI